VGRFCKEFRLHVVASLQQHRETVPRAEKRFLVQHRHFYNYCQAPYLSIDASIFEGSPPEGASEQTQDGMQKCYKPVAQ